MPSNCLWLTPIYNVFIFVKGLPYFMWNATVVINKIICIFLPSKTTWSLWFFLTNCYDSLMKDWCFIDDISYIQNWMEHVLRVSLESLYRWSVVSYRTWKIVFTYELSKIVSVKKKIKFNYDNSSFKSPSSSIL